MTQLATGAIQSAVQVTLEGRGDITLRPSDYVTSGGEGAIYKPSPATIIKLYSDPSKFQKDGMADKLKQLSGINHPFIVSPQGLVIRKSKPIGYYMSFVEGEPLARVFTTAFRQRENFTDKHAIELVDGMRTVVQIAHQHKATLVDANEYNWLMVRNKQAVEPRVIDVDSWAIDRWKPSVIMPSVRDWHAKSFDERSDWFSFAVVSFQVFAGIHPYKGKLAGYAMNEMEQRMKANASVFTKGIGLNSAVRDFACIPSPLLDWYEAVFQNGERSVPPSPKDQCGIRKTIALQTVALSASDKLVFDLLFNGTSDAPLEIYPCGIVRLASGTLVSLSSGRAYAHKVCTATEVIDTDLGYLVAEQLAADMVRFHLFKKDGTIIQLQTALQGKKLFRYQNRLFLITDSLMIEIALKEIGKPLLVIQSSTNILSAATTWYTGVGIQQSLGAVHLVLPFDERSNTFVGAPELKDLKIVDAAAGTRCATVIALDPRTGQYESYSFVFSKDYASYSVQRTAATGPELNTAFLPKGVCASIYDDGTLTITVPTNGQVKHVTDKHIKTSFVLGNWDNTVVLIHGKKVWKMTMK